MTIPIKAIMPVTSLTGPIAPECNCDWKSACSRSRISFLINLYSLCSFAVAFTKRIPFSTSSTRIEYAFDISESTFPKYLEREMECWLTNPTKISKNVEASVNCHEIPTSSSTNTKIVMTILTMRIAVLIIAIVRPISPPNRLIKSPTFIWVKKLKSTSNNNCNPSSRKSEVSVRIKELDTKLEAYAATFFKIIANKTVAVIAINRYSAGISSKGDINFWINGGAPFKFTFWPKTFNNIGTIRVVLTPLNNAPEKPSNIVPIIQIG